MAPFRLGNLKAGPAFRLANLKAGAVLTVRPPAQISINIKSQVFGQGLLSRDRNLYKEGQND